MKLRKIILTALLLALPCMVFGQAKKATRKPTAKSAASKAAQSKTAASKAIGAFVFLDGGEDVKSIAVDSKNVYVTMIYSKRMVVIDKATGALQNVIANRDITGVAVAGDKCYYFVDDDGLYKYDPVSGSSEGPLFNLDPYKVRSDLFATSQDGRFLLCGEYLINVDEGRVVSDKSSGEAVNNLGGVYSAIPEAYYTPLDGERYKVTPVGTAVSQIYPDVVTGNVYYCMADGLGVSPMVPQPLNGVEKLNTGIEKDLNNIMYITRDDEGNFVIYTNFEGFGFGGKSIEDPFKMEKKIVSGVKDQWGYARDYTSGSSIIIPDGSGNLIFGSTSSPTVFIYNPKGIEGYSELRGKFVQSERP